MFTLAAAITGDLAALRNPSDKPIVIRLNQQKPRAPRPPRKQAQQQQHQQQQVQPQYQPQPQYQSPPPPSYYESQAPPGALMPDPDAAIPPTTPTAAAPAAPAEAAAAPPKPADPVAACVARIAALVRFPNNAKLLAECDWLMKHIKEANRTERQRSQSLAVDSGCVQSLVGVAGAYYGYDAVAKACALRTLASLCFSHQRNRVYLAENGVIELARGFINKHNPSPEHALRRNALALLNNLGGSPQAHDKLLAYYGAEEVVARVEDPHEEDDVAQQAIALLRNLAFNEKMRDSLLRAGTVAALAAAIPRFHLDPDSFAAMDIMMAIACLVGHEENSPYLRADERTLKLVVKNFRDTLKDVENRKTYVVWKLCMSISKLAVSDHNKGLMGSMGVIECLHTALEWTPPPGVDDNPERRASYAVTALWHLAFEEANRQRIKDDLKLLRIVRNLRTKATCPYLREKAAGLLFTLGCLSEDADGTCPVPLPTKPAGQAGHVMLSYSWAEQELVVRIKDRLKELGLTVWMDIENMSGNTLEAMSSAVENAGVVVVALSSNYKASANCRMEAEYALQRKRRIVPLLVEPGYSPDGWLGLLLGAKLFIDFTQPEYFEPKFHALVAELKGGAGPAAGPAPTATAPAPPRPAAASAGGGGGSDAALVAELVALRAENSEMRQEVRQMNERLQSVLTLLGA